MKRFLEEIFFGVIASAILRLVLLFMSAYWAFKGDYAHAAFDLLLVVAILAYEARKPKQAQE